MKKLLQIFAVLGLFFSLTSATCNVDDPTPEPEIKDYNCKCTYVAIDSLATPPTKEETTVVKGKSHDDANFECGKLKSKYLAQWYDGTCLLQ